MTKMEKANIWWRKKGKKRFFRYFYDPLLYENEMEWLIESLAELYELDDIIEVKTSKDGEIRSFRINVYMEPEYAVFEITNKKSRN